MEHYFQCIIHLAATSSHSNYINNSLKTLRSNSIGAMKVFESASYRNSGVIYVSSSEVYANAKILPTAKSCYVNVSFRGLGNCHNVGLKYSTAITVTHLGKIIQDTGAQRLFNVYNAKIKQDYFYGKVLPISIQQHLISDVITIHGDLEQVRSSLNLKDSFIMLLKDSIYKSNSYMAVPSPIIYECSKVGSSFIVVEIIPKEKVVDYGIADSSKHHTDLVRKIGITEKLEIFYALSNLGITGICAFQFEIYSYISKLFNGKCYKLQIWVTINNMSKYRDVSGCIINGEHYYINIKEMWNRTFVEFVKKVMAECFNWNIWHQIILKKIMSL